MDVSALRDHSGIALLSKILFTQDIAKTKAAMV